MRIKLAAVAIVMALAAGVAVGRVKLMDTHGDKQKVRLAIGGPWQSIVPGQQHTQYANVVLSNQFDTLVGLNESGILVPLAAKSWEVSDDFKVFTFRIDLERRFSDGTYLEAADFKRSWEEGLRLLPPASNSSLLDVLYALDGFEDFARSGTIAGLHVLSRELLQLRFSRPFRMALAHLSGSRYSVFKKVGDHCLGTGKYVIRELAPDELELSPNPFAEGASSLFPINLTWKTGPELSNALLTGTIDGLVHGAGFLLPPEIISNQALQVVPGPDAIHLEAKVNATGGRVFSERRFRRAIQYVLGEIYRKRQDPTVSAGITVLDQQIFLPLQPGRLDDDEVRRLVQDGARYADELRAISRERSIIALAGSGRGWVLDALREYGLALSDACREVPMNEWFKILYKPGEYDLLIGGFGLAHGDPDGIYHALGKTGAILNPVTYRERVGRLLEEGRQIVDMDRLDEHYKKVSRAVLEEVPIVHLGFSKAVAVVRKDRLSVEGIPMKRQEGHFEYFKLK